MTAIHATQADLDAECDRTCIGYWSRQRVIRGPHAGVIGRVARSDHHSAVVLWLLGGCLQTAEVAWDDLKSD